MELNFKKVESIDLDNVNYGDVLILENDSKWLVVKDVDGYDYRGINLETYATTDFRSTIDSLVKKELDNAVIKLIKSEDLVLGVK